MSQNGQTDFKNLAAFAARFLKFVWPLWRISDKLLLNKINMYCFVFTFISSVAFEDRKGKRKQIYISITRRTHKRNEYANWIRKTHQLVSKLSPIWVHSYSNLWNTFFCFRRHLYSLFMVKKVEKNKKEYCYCKI